jgi:hypothetical protein
VGTAATSGGNPGGHGGAIVIDATAGGITLGGSLSTTGGNGNAPAAAADAGSITISDDHAQCRVTLSAVGGTGGTPSAGGISSSSGTVDGNAAGMRWLDRPPAPAYLRRAGDRCANRCCR